MYLLPVGRLQRATPDSQEDAAAVRAGEQHGWKKPSCYQGEYSLVSRGAETKLLPLLRAHRVRFNAFRSVAAGFLTGKAARGAAVTRFDAAARERGAAPLEVAMRWIVHHSALGDGDGVIIGASRTSQVVETVGLARKGPLSDDLLELVDELWDAVKETRGNMI